MGQSSVTPPPPPGFELETSPAPPAGFVLEEASTPPLPPGFELETRADSILSGRERATAATLPSRAEFDQAHQAHVAGEMAKIVGRIKDVFTQGAINQLFDAGNPDLQALDKTEMAKLSVPVADPFAGQQMLPSRPRTAPVGPEGRHYLVNPDLVGRIKDVFTQGALGQRFAAGSPDLKALDKTAVPAMKQPIVKLSALEARPDAESSGIFEGARRGFVEGIEGFSSAEGLAMLASLGKLGKLKGAGQAAAAGIGAGFDLDMISSAVAEVPEAKKLWDAGQQGEAARVAVRSLLSAGLGAAGASGKVKAFAGQKPIPEQPRPTNEFRFFSTRTTSPIAAKIQERTAAELADRTTSRVQQVAKKATDIDEQAAAKQLLAQRQAEEAAAAAAKAKPAPPRMSRAQRRALSEIPETGAPEVRDVMVDPKLEAIARDLDLGEYDKLSDADKATVRKLRDEGATAKPETKSAESETIPAKEETISPDGETSTPIRETGADSGEGTAPTPRQPRAAPVYGRETEVRIPGERTRYKAVYALREADDVYASHNPVTFEKNPDYEHTNDRNYTEPQNAERIVKQTAEFDPAFVVNDNPTAENGPPIIDSNGNVLGGNSRTMTLARVETGNPEGIRQYREAIAKEAKKFGLDPTLAARMKRPVLVREAVDVADAQRAITDFNKVGTAELRQAERAIADSRRVTPRTLDELGRRIEEQGPEGTLAQAIAGDARPIVERLVEDGVITTQEKPRLMNADGSLTTEGKSRVTRLLTGRLFEDARGFDDAAPELKGKLERAVAPLARVEGREGWDLSEATREAVALAEEARRRDITIEDLTRQQSMFGVRAYSEQAVAIARKLREKPTEVARAFRQYANEADLARDGQDLLAIEPPTPEDAFRAAFEEPAPAKPVSMLDRAEAKLKERIEARYKDAGKTLSAGPALAAEQLADYAALGAVKIAKGAVRFAEWSKQMVDELGEAVRPHLARIWTESLKVHQRQQAAAPAGGESGPRNPGMDQPRRGLSVSPSYDRTKLKMLDRVDPAVKTAMEERLTDFEQRNPGRRRITFTEIVNEARDLDPSLVNALDTKAIREGETLHPAVRFAARETLNGLNQEIAARRKAFAEQVPKGMTGEQKLEATRRIEAMEQDARRLIDVLLPTRSQDGRNLAYHRIMAQQSFDVTYWMSRAKRAMGIPEGVDMPEQVIKDLQALTAAGEAAEQAAIAEATKAKTKAAENKAKAEAEAEVKAEIEKERPAGELTREEIVERKRREIVSRLKAAIKGEETSTTDPIMPEEREAFRQDPEILTLRAKLAEIRAGKAQAAGKSTREAKVEQARQAFVARLRAKAKGAIASADPVSPTEKALWETDAEVIALRAKIAANRPAPPPPPDSAAKQARYKERVLAKIAEKMAGVEKQRARSKWELTKEERAAVDADPQVRQARIALARKMAGLERTGWLDAISAYRRAGLLTSVRTHARNIGGNTAFQALEEVSRVPAAIVDSAFSLFSGERTVQGASARAIAKASREAATRGVREARQIMREGATEDQLASMDIVKEVNTGNRVFDGAANMVFRSMSASDRVFKVYAFERSLQEQMKLAKVDAPTEAMRVKAFEDAQFATFNNPNLIAQEWSTMKARLKTKGSAGKVAAFAMDIVVPFAQTPANIIARLVDYTPVGGAARGGVAIARMIQAKRITPEQQRAFSQAIGRGAVGSAMLYLGWQLQQAGVLTGASEDERGKRDVAEAAGRMPGSLLIDGKWRRIDAFSPLGNLLVLGATLARDQDKGAEAIVKGAAKTVIEQPMLQGAKDIIDTLERPMNSAKTLTGSIAGSFVPTAVADVASLGDDVRRDARGEGVLDAVVDGIAARLPGLRNTLPARRDVFGKPEEQTKAAVIDPTIGTEAKELRDPVLREMVRTGVSMSDGKPKKGEDRATFEMRQEVIGDAVKARLARVIESRPYQMLGDEAKQHRLEREVSKIREKASEAAKGAAWERMSNDQRRRVLRARLGVR